MEDEEMEGCIWGVVVADERVSARAKSRVTC